MRGFAKSPALLFVCVLLMTSHLSSAFFFNFFRSNRPRKQEARLPIDEQCVANARRGDCLFYKCFDHRHRCNGNGTNNNNYAIQYGWRFCSRFDLNYEQPTAEGKSWLNRTRLCAMEKMLEFYRSDAISCSQVDEEMKDAQAACEAEHGLCHGRLLIDNKEIFSDVYSLNRQSAVQFLQSVKHCTLQKFREAANWFSDQLHNIEDVGHSVRPFFRDLEKRVDQLKTTFQNEINDLHETFQSVGRTFGAGIPDAEGQDEEID